jgi:hypothetical protein
VIIHLHYTNSVDNDELPPATGTACGVLEPEDTFTEVAMQASCNECRAAYKVQPTDALGVKAPLQWTPKPHPRAEEILADVETRKAL